LAFIFFSKRLAELLFPHDGRVAKSVYNRESSFSCIQPCYYVCCQWIASKDFLNNYDFKLIANFLQNYKDVEWAYLGKYEGELSFAGKFDKKLMTGRSFILLTAGLETIPAVLQ
jgi:hypothetical protein